MACVPLALPCEGVYACCWSPETDATSLRTMLSTHCLDEGVCHAWNDRTAMPGPEESAGEPSAGGRWTQAAA